MNKLYSTISYTIILLIFSSSVFSQTWTKEKAKQWYKAGEWSIGLKLKAYKGLDIVEFAKQYTKNSKYWEKAFSYLKNDRLDTISNGKYYLMGDTVFVTVSDNKPRAFEKTRWEAHKKYIDIQYIAKGKEKMGVAPVEKASVADAYDEKKDVGFYNIPESYSKFYIAQPGTLLIFFPSQAHRPNIKVNGVETTKKIVIKIRAN